MQVEAYLLFQNLTIFNMTRKHFSLLPLLYSTSSFKAPRGVLYMNSSMRDAIEIAIQYKVEPSFVLSIETTPRVPLFKCSTSLHVLIDL